MFKVPVTIFVQLDKFEGQLRKYIFNDLVACNIRNVVLDDGIIRKIMEKPTLADEIQKDLDNAGLKFVDSHAPFGVMLDMNWPGDKIQRRILIERHKVHINIAASFGVDTMTIHVGNDNNIPDLPFEKQNDNIKEVLEQLLPEAEACGVTICIENIWSRLTTPENLISFIDYFKHPNLGLCYDAGHANIMDHGRLYTEGAAWERWNGVGIPVPAWEDKALEKMLPYVVNCHLHDNNGHHDMHRNIGSGNVNWNHIIPLLNKAPNLKNIQSEVIPIRESIPVSQIKKQLDWLNTIED